MVCIQWGFLQTFVDHPPYAKHRLYIPQQHPEVNLRMSKWKSVASVGSDNSFPIIFGHCIPVRLVSTFLLFLCLEHFYSNVYKVFSLIFFMFLFKYHLIREDILYENIVHTLPLYIFWSLSVLLA